MIHIQFTGMPGCILKLWVVLSNSVVYLVIKLICLFLFLIKFLLMLNV